MFNGNTLLNTPLAIDKGYLMSLVPSLAAEFMLMKSSPIQSVKEREMQYLSKINKQGEGKENMKFPVIVDIVGAITKYSTYFSYGTQFLGFWNRRAYPYHQEFRNSYYIIYQRL